MYHKVHLGNNAVVWVELTEVMVVVTDQSGNIGRLIFCDEAKHAYFKGLAQSLGNFINLPYSLAMRHQHLQCYWSTNCHELGLEVGPGMYIFSYLDKRAWSLSFFICIHLCV